MQETAGIKPTNHQISLDGINAVVSELRKFGFEPEVRGGRKKYVCVSSIDNSRSFQIRVKTKRDDWNWQTDLCVTGDESSNKELTIWIFVNLKQYAAPPQFWIVPDSWLHDDIKTAHQKYLNNHDGHRAKNDSSTHHSIDEARISEWQDRWDILKNS